MDIEAIPGFIFDTYPIEVYRRSQVLFSQGEQPKAVYFICSGRVIVFYVTPEGTRERVVWATPGESVGEMELIAQEKVTTFSAEVYLDKTELIAMQKDEFLHLFNTNHEFCAYIGRCLARKLSTSGRTITQNMISDALTLIKQYILEITRVELERHERVRISQTRPEIADSCGVSERTVNRCVAKLLGDDLICLDKGKIAIERWQFERLKVGLR